MPPALQPQPEIITLDQYEALPEDKRVEFFDGVVYDISNNINIFVTNFMAEHSHLLLLFHL